MPAKKGRPERHPVDAIRTRVWYQSVASAAGDIAIAQQIEQLLTGKGKDEDGIRRSKTWEKYRAGRRVASEQSVELAEGRFPGTRRYFDSPIWSALKASIRSKNELLESVRGLDPLVWASIHQGPKTHPFGVLWSLRELRTLDALAGMLVYYIAYADEMDVFLRGLVLDELDRFDLAEPALGTLQGEVSQCVRDWALRERQRAGIPHF